LYTEPTKAQPARRLSARTLGDYKKERIILMDEILLNMDYTFTNQMMASFELYLCNKKTLFYSLVFIAIILLFLFSELMFHVGNLPYSIMVVLIMLGIIIIIYALINSLSGVINYNIKNVLVHINEKGIEIGNNQKVILFIWEDIKTIQETSNYYWVLGWKPNIKFYINKDDKLIEETRIYLRNISSQINRPTMRLS
jgi:hypothetical protein